MKRITKINDNEYISKEVDHTTSFTGTIIELIKKYDIKENE